MPDEELRRQHRFARARRALAVLAIVAAALVGAVGALATVTAEKELSVGTIRLSVDPLHDGALDIYVPVVDWGARFPAIRLPARLKVDVRAVNRSAVSRIAAGQRVDVEALRGEARDAIASYLRQLVALILLAALAAGVVTAFAVRGGASPRLRVRLGVAAATAVVAAVAVALLLPPRGAIDEPQYYAFGPDIPRALQVLETARRSSQALDQELNAQLVGLARLVAAPAGRPPLDGEPQITLASDLHNNAIMIDVLERTAGGGPIFFAGDLTDRGTSLETRLVRRIVQAGMPFVFVSGNHDSDALERELARDGAIVLSDQGRLLPDGRRAEMVVEVAGLRVAGYSDPFVRLRGEGFRDRYESEPGPERQAAFAAWLRGLAGEVDVVMLHDERLAATVLPELAEDPELGPLVLLVGHTHRPGLRRVGPVTVINGGSIGAGGTGNLAEGTPIGLARLAFSTGPFAPLAADLVEIEPATGSSTARRERLDNDPLGLGD